ncbi:hypothetical protein SASPL_107800 [Salvia splendens]|uniref:Pectin acetylesterase n=1 Tax=Salvia splendens TaxID=180675 RepID=A0A8X9A5M4_SALSN|nr:hypothetical protein SASPL_107800 [Salvia splendens]
MIITLTIWSCKGGAWCDNIGSCLDRSTSYIGSCAKLISSKNGIQSFDGMLDDNSTYNPDFYNWHVFKIFYCDGSSFMSDVEDVDPKHNLTYRGARIYDAMMDELLRIGMGNAKNTIAQAVGDWYFDWSEFQEIDMLNDLPRNCISIDDQPTLEKKLKISPWTLARLNAEDVSKAAAEARKKSKILRPVVRHESNSYAHETDSSFGSSGRNMALLGPITLEARSDFRGMPAVNVASSPESSSLDSPDIHPFRVFSSGAEEGRRLARLSSTALAAQKDIPLSRSTSDGYDASGGEDSDRVPTRFLHRPNNWNNMLFGSEAERSSSSRFIAPTSSTFSSHRNL